jgi:hypothetical protein
MPGTRIVLELMLAGSIGLLKSTATSRVVPIAVIGGTSITTVGPPDVGGGSTTLPQLMRKAATRREDESLETCEIDIQLLSQYLGEVGRRHQAAGAALIKTAKLAGKNSWSSSKA